MAQDDPLTQPVKIDDLLLSKRLEPLAAAHAATLVSIAKLDIGTFSEAEVRSYIVDPIVRILGYDKGTIFSADLEHPLKFLGRNLFPDYKVALWNANFWLIEAKRPNSKLAFEYDELAQAIEYSIHPSINAALAALCEGYYSIFKRGMKGVYQHCKEKHLHRYLSEFDFRYSNRVALGVNDGERADLAIKGAAGKRLTYRQAY
jgi:ISXO2 transposase-like protein